MNRLSQLLRVNDKTLILLICLVLLPFVSANAQMFSVRSAKTIESVPSIGVYLGYQPADFYYKPSGSGTNNTTRFDFKDPIYRLQLELSGIDIYIGNGWNLGPDNGLNFFNIGAHIQGYLRAYQTPHFTLQFPVRLQTDYIQVQSKRTANASDMQESSGTIGTGPMISLRLGNMVRFTSNMLLNYGFSVQSMGTTSGTIYELTNSNRLYFDNVYNNIGLSLGFDYNFKRYNMSGISYDYAFKGYSILFGITF